MGCLRRDLMVHVEDESKDFFDEMEDGGSIQILCSCLNLHKPLAAFAARFHPHFLSLSLSLDLQREEKFEDFGGVYGA